MAGELQIKEVKWFHDAIIDEMIANPAQSQGELARKFGYTQAWMSIMVNSDAFRHRLQERKAEIVDPRLLAEWEDRVNGIAHRALDRIMEKLDNPASNMKTMELVSIAKLGVETRAERARIGTQQNLYVINVPPPEKTARDWLSSSSRAGVVDVSHVNPEA